MFVKERFKLSPYAISLINDLEPAFGYDGFGEFIFYRTYSRWNGEKQESWHDCVIRVIEGCMSIRKDWYIKNHISWVEKFWQEYALKMAISLFKMEWLAPGRGLWAMGTDFIYERGSMALYNCAFTNINNDFENDLAWFMDSLMLGVGVGFSPHRDNTIKFSPRNEGRYDFEIPDSREGWVESLSRLIIALRYGSKKPRMIYDKVRPAGLPIRGFGGISSGPDPLMYLHEKTEELCSLYMDDPYYDSVMLKTDLANLTGCCVVAGNVRRSAEQASLSIKDPVFKDLKNYEDPRYAYRAEWGWMSNNSVDLEDDSDFDLLDEIAERVKTRGEPGYKNLQNFQYGRIGKKIPVRLDDGIGNNPCHKYDTLVLTKNGIRQFGEIKENDQIWSESGWTRVIKKWSTGVNKVYKYRTTAGYFEGTENHKVICDYMKIPVCNAYAIDIITGPYKKNLEFNCQDIIDGLAIGDGSVRDKIIYLMIGLEDNYFTKELTPFIHRCGNHDYSYEITTTLSIDEVPFTYLREVPERFLRGDRQKVCSFLRGLYSANGSICGNRITLKAASFKIIEQVQVMLNSIGIRSYYTTNKTKEVEFNNGIYLCKQSYDLNISTDREKFAESIGFIHEEKNSRLKDLIDNLYQSKYGHHSSKTTYDIISVELISEEETFDITVDNDSHTYWTAGCNVSNCLSGETKICLADGRGFVPIKELEGTDANVYCINENDEIVVKWMRHARKTGTNQKILKVIFDNDYYIRVTENHRLMLKDCSFREAKDLMYGDQFAQFNRNISNLSVIYKGQEFTNRQLPLSYYQTDVIDGIVHVVKYCETCKKPFPIPYKKREQAFCSVFCSDNRKDYNKARENAAKAWEEGLRVLIVQEDGYENVYNGTVDDYHNFIIGGWEHKDCKVQSGIVSFQCGEIVLCHRETCNVVETLPTICNNPETWLKACEYATLYSSTISLLPTHQPETNKIVAKNRRIGVGVIDYTGWKLEHGVNKVTKWMRIGYDTVTRVNQWANSEAGVPESIRKTTIKPGGTTPKLAGRTPGIGHPTFTHTLRRVIIAKNSPLVPLLRDANVPLEQKANDPGSLIVQWPIIQGPAKPAYEISLWEQAMNLVLVQREWADNAVSNTLYFKPKWVLIGLYQDTKTLTDFLSEKVDLYKVLAKIDSENEDFQIDKYRIKTQFDEETGKIIEISLYIFDRNHEEDSIEPVLSAIAPLTKSVSLLPHSPKGVYEQMPEEGISEQEYWIRKQSMRKIDWSKLTGSTGEDERYCQGNNCEIAIK